MVSLLACGVPDLEFDAELRQGLGEEGRTDGGLLVVCELSLDETQDQRALAGAHVAKENLGEERCTHAHETGGRGDRAQEAHAISSRTHTMISIHGDLYAVSQRVHACEPHVGVFRVGVRVDVGRHR